VRKLPRTYVCRRCGRTYFHKEYEQNRFCRNCETYLILENMISRLPKRIGESGKGKPSEERWLPKGYEVRERQMEFIGEASGAISNFDGCDRGVKMRWPRSKNAQLLKKGEFCLLGFSVNMVGPLQLELGVLRSLCLR
jgi:hypothetical protein